MTPSNQPLRRVLTIAGVAVALSALVTWGIDIPLNAVAPRAGGGMGPGHGMATPFEPVLRAKIFLSTFNLFVILALGWTYLSLYRELPNPFTGSLLVVTAALFLYALSSNPVISLLFGYRGGIGLGPFTFLPDLFAAVAVVLLLYQSSR
jgi:hypothetical protein